MTLEISEPKLKPDASEKLLRKKSSNSMIIFYIFSRAPEKTFVLTNQTEIFILRTLIFDVSLSIHLVAYIVSRQENMRRSQ